MKLLLLGIMTMMFLRFILQIKMEAPYIGPTGNKLEKHGFLYIKKKLNEGIDSLSHLEGKEVCVTRDKFILSDPLNPDFKNKIKVTKGQIELPAMPLDENKKRLIWKEIVVGLPIVSDLQTLNFDTAEESMVDRIKNTGTLFVAVQNSMIVWAGPNKPDSDTLNGLEKQSTHSQKLGQQIDPKTMVFEIEVQGEWNSHGSVFFRNVSPVPLHILSITQKGFLGRR